MKTYNKKNNFYIFYIILSHKNTIKSLYTGHFMRIYKNLKLAFSKFLVGFCFLILFLILVLKTYLNLKRNIEATQLLSKMSLQRQSRKSNDQQIVAIDNDKNCLIPFYIIFKYLIYLIQRA